MNGDVILIALCIIVGILSVISTITVLIHVYYKKLIHVYYEKRKNKLEFENIEAKKELLESIQRERLIAEEEIKRSKLSDQEKKIIEEKYEDLSKSIESIFDYHNKDIKKET